MKALTHRRESKIFKSSINMATRWELRFPIHAVALLEHSVSSWLAALAGSWSNSWWCRWQPSSLHGFVMLQKRTQFVAPRRPKHNLCLAQNKANLSPMTKDLNLTQWSSLWSPSHLKQKDQKWFLVDGYRSSRKRAVLFQAAPTPRWRLKW